MEMTITDIFKSKVVEIIIVALVLYAGVFLINRFVQVLFKRTDFLEERKGKTIESLVRSSPSIRRRSVLSFTSFHYLFMISGEF